MRPDNNDRLSDYSSTLEVDFLSQTGFEIEIGANFYKLRNKKERPNVVASFQGSRSNDEDNSDEDDNDVNNDGNGCFFSSPSAVSPTLFRILILTFSFSVCRTRLDMFSIVSWLYKYSSCDTKYLSSYLSQTLSLLLL